MLLEDLLLAGGLAASFEVFVCSWEHKCLGVLSAMPSGVSQRFRYIPWLWLGLFGFSEAYVGVI